MAMVGDLWTRHSRSSEDFKSALESLDAGNLARNDRARQNVAECTRGSLEECWIEMMEHCRYDKSGQGAQRWVAP